VVALLLGAAAAVLAAADTGPRPAAPRINIGGIVNAASHRPAPDNYLSPGSIISIYGIGLANETREARQDDMVNGRLPENLGGASVWFGSVKAPLFYVSPLQINAQAPVELGFGDWVVRVQVNSLESAETVVVRKYSPGLFATMRHADGTLVSRELPARPGQWVLVYGTGFGSTHPYLPSGVLAPMQPTWWFEPGPPAARIGDVSLAREDIYYWGLAPGFAGLYQFNLRIPASAPAGDLEVQVQVAEEWSQPGVRIPVTR
jgi:uncharacterized protein (TIGR03437 family)